MEPKVKLKGRRGEGFGLFIVFIVPEALSSFRISRNTCSNTVEAASLIHFRVTWFLVVDFVREGVLRGLKISPSGRGR